jgi:hypothetical protein
MEKKIEITGSLKQARISNGYFKIEIKTDYERRHSGSETNQILVDLKDKKTKVTIIIEQEEEEAS